jgi:hypothetical protein
LIREKRERWEGKCGCARGWGVKLVYMGMDLETTRKRKREKEKDSTYFFVVNPVPTSNSASNNAFAHGV